MSSYGPLARWLYSKMFNWFALFKNCNQKSMMHTVKNMHQILSLSNYVYEEIFQEIDTDGLVKNGIIYLANKTLQKIRN